MFDDEMIVDVDVDALGEDVVWQKRKSLNLRTWKNLVRTKQSRCKDGWRSCESSWRTSGMPVTWGTQNTQSIGIARNKGRQLSRVKKLTSFFASFFATITNGDNNNEYNISKQQT